MTAENVNNTNSIAGNPLPFDHSKKCKRLTTGSCSICTGASAWIKTLHWVIAFLRNICVHHYQVIVFSPCLAKSVWNSEGYVVPYWSWLFTIISYERLFPNKISWKLPNVSRHNNKTESSAVPCVSFLQLNTLTYLARVLPEQVAHYDVVASWSPSWVRNGRLNAATHGTAIMSALNSIEMESDSKQSTKSSAQKVFACVLRVVGLRAKT